MYSYGISFSELRNDYKHLIDAWFCDFLSVHVCILSGTDAGKTEQQILKEDEENMPSDFSDATTEDDIDLSKLTPAQRRQYLAEKERRRKEREKRRREKYGDKYDEIMKKKNAYV